MSTLATTNIKHPSSASNNIVLDSSGNVVLQAGSASTPALQPSGDTNTGIFFPAADTIAFAEGGVESARIDSSGRLLVGTSTSLTGTNNSQYARLQVVGNTAGTPRGGLIALGRDAAASAMSSGDFLGGLVFTDNGSAEFAHIFCFTDAASGANDYPSRLEFSTTVDGASSPTERMRINRNGNVGMLCTSDDNALYLNHSGAAGTSFYFIYANHSASTTTGGTGTTSFRVFTNGNVQNTNNSYGSISDLKLKENIVDATSQWNDLKALQVRNYNFKEETGHQTHTQIGLVAQEVELVSPGLVGESPDRDDEGNDLGTVTKSVNYSVLYMKAVKALQEAIGRIEQLETSNADLLVRVTALEAS